jgi:hypothetical protein
MHPDDSDLIDQARAELGIDLPPAGRHDGDGSGDGSGGHDA